MNKYSEIYKKVPTESEIQKIKRVFSGTSMSTSWEDYFWAGKCISEYDTEEFDAKLLADMMNKAIRYGLTFRGNREYYLEAIKVLATVYGVTGQYQLVCNCLGAILELDENAPDWVYHDFVAAQNRTKGIKRNLRRPKQFLEDLSHNQGNKEETRRKQINIFKEFLSAGIVYLSEYPESEVDIATLKKAAEKYNLMSSKEMKTFLDVCAGKISVEIKTKVEDIENFEKANSVRELNDTISQDYSVRKRPLVISLFSNIEEENDENQMLQDISIKLEDVQTKLDEKTNELKKAGDKVEKLTLVNNSLRTTIDKYQGDIEEYEEKIKEKQQLIQNLQIQITKVKKGTEAERELEKQLIKTIAQKETVEKNIDNVKKALEESEERLEIAQKIIKEKEDENRNLRKKMESEYNKTYFSCNISAHICGMIKVFEVIITDKLSDWLIKQLSYYRDWWEQCVISKLTSEQTIRAQQSHYTSLKDFDLAALLRIFNNNWKKIQEHRFMAPSEYQCLQEMRNIRNKNSHQDSHPVNKNEAIQILETMSDFLLIIGASDERKEIVKYTEEVMAMSIE